MEHNRTGPPCSVGHRTGHAPGGGRPPTCPVAGSVKDDDDSEQNNTGPLGGPVMVIVVVLEYTRFVISDLDGIAEFAGLEFAGLENDGRSRRGGICRTGK